MNGSGEEPIPDEVRMAMISTVATKSQKQITRECHFLPICYQQPFTGPSGELFVQFLDKDKPILLHPSVVGKMNDFYTQTINGVEDDTVEKLFSSLVEGDYAAIAKRITKEKNSFVFKNKEEAFTLLKFVATQVVRTYAHRRCINEQAGTKVSQDVFIHNMHRKLNLIIDRWIRHTPDIALWTPLPHLGCQFITGDNPVLCFTNVTDGALLETLTPPKPRIIDLTISLESSHSGFIVPLSPYICLTVINSGHRDLVKLRPPRSLEPHVVRDFNRMIYNQCVQFVAAQDPEHLAFHVCKS